MINRAAACVTLACLLSIASSCSPHAGQPGVQADGDLRAQTASPGGTAAPAVTGAGARRFDLVSYTGSTLRAVFISPSDSTGWGGERPRGEVLADGATVAIGFNPGESAGVWDVKVEAADGHYAEWKRLDLRDASRITLLVSLVGEPVVVAEIE